MSGMVHTSGVSPHGTSNVFSRSCGIVRGPRGIWTLTWHSKGLPQASPKGERGPLAVHDRAGVAVDEDVHRLPLVLVLHEPHGGVEELAVVRRRGDLDRLERVHALLRLLLDELFSEGAG